MNISPTTLKVENPTHITAFDTVRGLAALSHRWLEIPSMAFGKSMLKRFAEWKLRRDQPAQPVDGK